MWNRWKQENQDQNPNYNYRKLKLNNPFLVVIWHRHSSSNTKETSSQWKAATKDQEEWLNHFKNKTRDSIANSLHTC